MNPTPWNTPRPALITDAAPWTGARSRLFVLLAIISCALGLSPRPVQAWGRLGHRVSARLAEARLTPEAKAAIRDLLDPAESLADAATWPDDHRRDTPNSGPWHYVNVPISEEKYSSRFCPESGCVVSKLDEFRRILADQSVQRDRRRVALRFVVHLVQDIHQPLHVGDRGDRGGNDLQVQFFGQGSNLHRIWDSGLFDHDHEQDREPRSESAWIEALTRSIDPEKAGRWARSTSPEDWANESLAVARRAYCPPGSDVPLRSGAKIGEAYEQANLPIARERLEESAVRLAVLLNATLK
jgi:nuclease S1